MDMTTTRWLCVPAGPYSVNLVPAGEHAAGPDVFVKAEDLDRLRTQNDALAALLRRAAVHVADVSCGGEPTLSAVAAACALLAEINKALTPNAAGKAPAAGAVD